MELNIRTAIVYLIDDDFAIRDSLTLLLESTGRQVKSFDSAEAFLYNFDRTQPACLILDMIMPGMGGLALQKELSNKNINIPIIFISGDVDNADSAKIFRYGALNFLEKPFDHRILLERIDDAIRGCMPKPLEFS